MYSLKLENISTDLLWRGSFQDLFPFHYSWEMGTFVSSAQEIIWKEYQIAVCVCSAASEGFLPSTDRLCGLIISRNEIKMSISYFFSFS